MPRSRLVHAHRAAWLVLLASLAACGCGFLPSRGNEAGTEATPGPSADATERPPLEVFLVFKTADELELRLRSTEETRYSLTSPEEIARVIAERQAREVILRHGANVPQGELDALTAFLRDQGVERVPTVVAPKPPHNPMPAPPGDGR